jgi:hypothetical protein
VVEVFVGWVYEQQKMRQIVHDVSAAIEPPVCFLVGAAATSAVIGAIPVGVEVLYYPKTVARLLVKAYLLEK